MTDNSFKIDANNSTLTIGPTLVSVGIVHFIQKDKPRLKYVPQTDITPYESSLLIPLFAVATVPNYSVYYDYWEYIESNGLMRHFVESD